MRNRVFCAHIGSPRAACLGLALRSVLATGSSGEMSAMLLFQIKTGSADHKWLAQTRDFAPLAGRRASASEHPAMTRTRVNDGHNSTQAHTKTNTASKRKGNPQANTTCSTAEGKSRRSEAGDTSRKRWWLRGSFKQVSAHNRGRRAQSRSVAHGVAASALLAEIEDIEEC